MELPTETGELLTRWTIRAALVLYVVGVALRVPTKRDGAARVVWTLGCTLYLAHVACAFHFYHNWSHASAYAEVARRSDELFGFAFGGGLYFNYVFTAAWCLDVIRMWSSRRSQSSVLTYALHGFMAFMAFQATVVFETGTVRWAGVGCTVLLVLLCLRRRKPARPAA